MPRYYGRIGYASSKEVSPGVWVEGDIIERSVYGDMLQNSRNIESPNQINDDLNIGNEFSIIADPYAYEHFWEIRYITWMGARWKVTKVQVRRPRLVLSVGGLWNGETPDSASGKIG